MCSTNLQFGRSGNTTTNIHSEMASFDKDLMWRFAVLEALKEHLNALSIKTSSSLQSMSTGADTLINFDSPQVMSFIDTVSAINSGNEQYDPPFYPVAKYLTDLLLPPSISLRYIELVSEKVDSEPVQDGRAKALRTQMHLIACTAASIVLDEDREDVVFDAVSTIMAQYLDHLIEISTQGDSSIDGGHRYIQEVLAGLKKTLVSCPFLPWRSTFMKVLQSHLDAAGATLENHDAEKREVHKLRELGNNLMTNLSYPQAIKVYTTAIDLCTIHSANNLAQLYTNRAIAFIGLNCYSEAIQDLRLAVSRDRTFAPAYAQLGYCELYMGRTLHALRGYKNALDAMAGNIDPPNTNLDFQQKQEYKDAMARSVFPPFVHKLVQALILTEKRAKQQRVSPNDIRLYISQVRTTLSELQSVASPEDRHFFNYTYDENFDNLRNTAGRAEQHRPSILTPEVALDILAGSLMEASTVSIPITGMPGMGRPRRRETENNAETQTTTANNPPDRETDNASTETQRPDTSIRGLMNQLGDIFGDMMQVQTLTYFPNDAPRNADGGSNPFSFDIMVETGDRNPSETSDSAQDPQRGEGQMQRSTHDGHNNSANNSTNNSTNTTQADRTGNQGDEAANNSSRREGSPVWDLSESLNQMLSGDYQPIFSNIMRRFEAQGSNGNRQSTQTDALRELVRVFRQGQGSQNTSNQASTSGSTLAQREQNDAEDQSMPDAPDLD